MSPNLGAVAAVLGAGLGFVGGVVAPDGPSHDAVVLVAAALVFGAASALALRLGPRAGPTQLVRGEQLGARSARSAAAWSTGLGT